MISYKQIKKSINDKLKGSFQVEINSKDIQEGFTRPSFFVEFDNMNRQGLESQVERSFTTRIYYFPKNKDAPSMEILDVLETLESLFELKLQVSDRHFNILETDSNVTDGILQFEFDIAFADGREIEQAEYMTQLKYNEVQ